MLCACICASYQQQQQHHVRVVTHTRYVQGRPQVLVLQVGVHASLHQDFRREHVVMASTLEMVSTEMLFFLTIYRNSSRNEDGPRRILRTVTEFLLLSSSVCYAGKIWCIKVTLSVMETEVSTEQIRLITAN